MSKISQRFIENDVYGIASFEAKHDYKYYEKHFLYQPNSIICGEGGAIHTLRYIDWSDKTGFVRAPIRSLPYLCHKMPRKYKHFPHGFDHTSFWKKPGDRWPLFCLTEPYDRGHKSISELEDSLRASYEKLYRAYDYNFEFKIFERSEKSIWVPNATYMIFCWCPDYFDFSSHEKLLMSHDGIYEFKKRCMIERR